MNVEKVLSEHSGPSIRPIEWYREQRQQIEKLWRKHIDMLLDTSDKPKGHQR